MNRSVTNYRVTLFKSLRDALKELEPYVRNGKDLQNGRPFKQLGGLLPREVLGNWMLCVAINSVTQSDRLTFSSDPTGGDGIICDRLTNETWRTEHVIVPDLPGGNAHDFESQILEKIALKCSKGPTYANGKTLVVFLNAKGDGWMPINVSRRLPVPLHFENVWVFGLNGVEGGEYTYNVTRLDPGQGHPQVWRVRIAKDFSEWRVGSA